MQSETKGSHVCNHHTTAAKLQKSIVTNYRLQKHLSSAIITYYISQGEGNDKYLCSYVQNLLHLVVHFPFEPQQPLALGHLHLSGGHEQDDPSQPLQVHGQQPAASQLSPH